MMAFSNITSLATLPWLAIREVETVDCFCNCVAGGGTEASDHPGWPKCKASPRLLVIKPLRAGDSGQHGQTLQERAPAAFRLYLIGAVKHATPTFVNRQSCVTMHGANLVAKLSTV